MQLTPRLIAALVGAPLVLASAGCVVAPPPPPPAHVAHHPAYLHALTDLRDARWNLQHRPGDSAVSTQEDIAIVEIDRAINEAKTAAMEDHKNLAEHPLEDARIDRRGRLHQAEQLLRQARRDVAESESNPHAVDLRNRVIGHIDLAIQATERAIRDAEQGH